MSPYNEFGSTDVVFPASDVANPSSLSDRSFLFNSIQFDGAGFDVAAGQDSLPVLQVIGGKILANNTSGVNHLEWLGVEGFHTSTDPGIVHSIQVARGGELDLGAVSTFFPNVLQKDGEGTLSVGGPASWNAVTLNAGTLIVNDPRGLGQGPLQLNGGTIRSGAPSGQTFTLTNPFTVAGPVTFGGSNDLTFTGLGQITTDSQGTAQTLTVANTQGTVKFTGVLYGPGKLTKTDDGVLELDGTNRYEGGTDLQGGTLIVGNDRALGDVSGTLNLEGGNLESFDTFVTLANPFTVSRDAQVSAVAIDPLRDPLHQPIVSSLTFTGLGTLMRGMIECCG